MIIAAHVHRLILRRDQLSINLGFVFRQRFSQRGEACLQVLILRLRSQCLRPVKREVKMAAPVINFPTLARR